MRDPFYHVPTTSPCPEVPGPARDLRSGRTSPARSEYDDGFEFQISWTSVPDEESSLSQESHQAIREKQRARGKSLPTMAFADELFRDGKVMPLRPPPRLHFGNRSWNPSPDASPPTSPNPASRLLLQRRKFWNDDFDPFTVALEKVRVEDRGRTQVRSHRRAQSLSPFRAFKSSGTGEATSNPNQALQTPDKDVKTDYKRNPVNAYISKSRGIKRLFSFASFGSSSCLRPQIHPQFHLGGEKPRKRR